MKRIFTFLLCLILLLSGCKKSSNPVAPTSPGGTSGNISTGQSVSLISQPVSTGGGTITVSKPGDPLNGFVLTVPPNSFTGTKNFSISYAQVTNHNFGSDFTAISPLITISYEGDYSDQFMTIKIPIKLPAGSFAMGFIYDNTTQQLEGLPLEELTDSTVVIATKHFSSFSQLNKSSIVNTNWEDNLIIFSVLESKLSGNLIIASGFYPGFDDWEFVNWGTYISPGGMCAGQSITAMWYYLEKSKTTGTLFHRYDALNDKTIPNFMWYDNPLGIRFASTIQEDLNTGTEWVTEIQKQSAQQNLTWKSFLQSMLITKQPQLVFIRKSSGGNGHAMIVYKIDLTAKKMYVADPNYPGNYDYETGNQPVEKVINYTDGKFQPYIASGKAGDTLYSFDQIGFFGITQYIPINKIRSRWTEVLNGTIGNDRFPKYSLTTYPDNRQVTDGLVISSDSLRVICVSTDCASGIDPVSHLQPVEIYDSTGVDLAEADQTNNGIAAVKLNAGNNKLGFYIQGVRGPGYTNVRFVDFKWMNISKSSLTISITPNPLNGVQNTSYSFIVNKINGQLPSQYKCVWDFGDNTSAVTVQNTLVTQHTFTIAGNYNIRCDLYDNSTNNLIASATSQANILTAFLADLFGTKSVGFNLTAYMLMDDGSLTSSLAISSDYYSQTQKFIWNGYSFSQDINYKVSPVAGTDSTVVTGSLSGTVSNDGQTITTFTIHTRQETQSKNGYWIEQTITVTNLPFSLTNSLDNNLYRLQGPSVASHVTSLIITRNSPTLGTVNLKSVDYNSTSITPDLYILMQK